jgi:SAM-dependent methyltransferase
MVTVDIGTGDGQWAAEIAMDYAHAKVKGYDLSPIKSRFEEPENCIFHLGDLWDIDLDPGSCDFVHSRLNANFFRH